MAAIWSRSQCDKDDCKATSLVQKCTAWLIIWTLCECMSIPGIIYHYIKWNIMTCHQMETFSALLALCVGNSPVNGEFPSQRPVTRSFEVSFDMRLNKQLSKQSCVWWFETPSCSLWRHCNAYCSEYSTSEMTFHYLLAANQIKETLKLFTTVVVNLPL